MEKLKTAGRVGLIALLVAVVTAPLWAAFLVGLHVSGPVMLGLSGLSYVIFLALGLLNKIRTSFAWGTAALSITAGFCWQNGLTELSVGIMLVGAWVLYKGYTVPAYIKIA